MSTSTIELLFFFILPLLTAHSKFSTKSNSYTVLTPSNEGDSLKTIL